jgi:hypothetical protein
LAIAIEDNKYTTDQSSKARLPYYLLSYYVLKSTRQAPLFVSNHSASSISGSQNFEKQLKPKKQKTKNPHTTHTHLLLVRRPVARSLSCVDYSDGEDDDIMHSLHRIRHSRSTSFTIKLIFLQFPLVMSTPSAIGTFGTPWGATEKQLWLERQPVRRSYQEEVLTKIEALREHYTVEQYGALSFDAVSYPLFSLRSSSWDDSKQTVLITGGVHGYETSGVQGAIRFAEEYAKKGSSVPYNIVVFPCVSPWGYATINRWNPEAIDPNRSFKDGSGTIEESDLLYKHLATLNKTFIAHFDLHETTDTDKTTFRPALNALEGNTNPPPFSIPDGFYLVSDPARPVVDFNKAMIEAVEKVTHIVPAAMDCFSGVAIEQHGVIVLPKPASALGLCMGCTTAPFAVTTEVYPDSPLLTDEICTAAQVAAVNAGIEFISRLSN